MDAAGIPIQRTPVKINNKNTTFVSATSFISLLNAALEKDHMISEYFVTHI